MADKDALLDLDTRRTIFRHIETNPGLHLRALQRALDIPLGTLEYHLHQMERSNLLVVRDDGRYKAFFVEGGDLDRRDKDILYYVRQELPRQIVMALLLEPGLSHSAITERMPVGASTCSFHLKKLVKAQVLAEERVGRSKQFTVTEPDRTANVLVRFRKSFLDDLVDRFARAWLDLDRGNTQKRTVAPPGEAMAMGEATPTHATPDSAALPSEEARDATDEGKMRLRRALPGAFMVWASMHDALRLRLRARCAGVP